MTTMFTLPISIHAPARGATIRRISQVTGYTISIHAPARGATVYTFQVPTFKIYFNPRSREGSDEKQKAEIAVLKAFQSTLPRGERPCKEMKRAHWKNFNPRSREGSDDNLVIISKNGKEFQSTLPRGERHHQKVR